MPTTKAEITRGDSFEIQVTLTTGTPPAPLDLVAALFTPVMQIRQDVAQETPDATFGAVVSGTNNNIVTLILDATVTLALLIGGTYYARLLLRHATDQTLDQITERLYIFTVIESATKR